MHIEDIPKFKKDNNISNDEIINNTESKYIHCCECGKKALKIEAKKHKYNNNFNYCPACYHFWFDK
jgi:NAD-dependent SIR2 family protein deacetylase